MSKAVFCIARTRSEAELIVNDLKSAGFSPSDISVLFPDTQGSRDFAHEQHTKLPEGATTGAGATAGGVVAVIDFMPPRDQDPNLVRIVEGRRGRVREIYNLDFLMPDWVVEDVELLLGEPDGRE